jgi:hypothetical protein
MGIFFTGGNQPTGAGTGQRYQGCLEGRMNSVFSATNLRTAITHGLVVILKATFKGFFSATDLDHGNPCEIGNP